MLDRALNQRSGTSLVVQWQFRGPGFVPWWTPHATTKTRCSRINNERASRHLLSLVSALWGRWSPAQLLSSAIIAQKQPQVHT